MIGAGERTHADLAVERLLPRVDSDVAGQFVGAGEAAVAGFHGTCIGTLVHRGFAGAVGVLAGLDGEKFEWLLLVGTQINRGHFTSGGGGSGGGGGGALR